MAQQTVCRFFKFGYCKHLEKCRNMHVKEKCEKVSCEILNCDLRHPRKCKFFSEYRKCRFGEWCAFEHAEDEKDEGLKHKISEFERKMETLEKMIMDKDDIIEKLLNIEWKELSNKVENLEEAMTIRDLEIKSLHKKIENREKEVQNNDEMNEQETFDMTFCNPLA